MIYSIDGNPKSTLTILNCTDLWFFFIWLVITAESVGQYAGGFEELNFRWAPDSTALICFTSGILTWPSFTAILLWFGSSMYLVYECPLTCIV